MLASVGRQAFTDAFGHLYSNADLMTFMDDVYTPATIEEEIGDPLRLYQLAEDEAGLFGWCKLGFDSSLEFDCAGKRTMELKQLYLLGGRTGGGAGSTLMDWALGEARARGFEQIILSVYSENFGGQRFYQRHGFSKWGDTTFRVGQQLDKEFIYGRTI